jgi:aerobic-type carbon monoxide dehydrogenase small subunit (CoxS/CutS family)
MIQESMVGGRCGGGEVEACLVSHDGTMVKPVQHDNKVVTNSTFQTVEGKQEGGVGMRA